MKKINYRQFIQENTKDCDISYRGGSLKVDLSGLFTQTSLNKIEASGEEPIAGAYQNYLGGGMAGSIQSGRSFDTGLLTAGDYKKYEAFAEACKRYFYHINNGGGDDYMQENVTGQEAGGYEATQRLPVSGY